MKKYWMMNYFVKCRNNYIKRIKNAVDLKVKLLIDNIDFIVELLYPFAEIFVNRYITCEQTNGFSTLNNKR